MRALGFSPHVLENTREDSRPGSSLSSPAASASDLDLDSDTSWERVMAKHRLRSYGLSKETCDRTLHSAASCSPPQPTPPAPATRATHSSSAGQKSPIAKSRLLVDKIVNIYDSGNVAGGRVATRSKVGEVVECGRNSQQPHVDMHDTINHNHQAPQQLQTSLPFDWAQSALVKAALHGEDDTLAADMDTLLKHLERVSTVVKLICC